MSQQLSVKVADTLRRRFVGLFTTNSPSAYQIMELPFDTLRQIGLSASKTQYIFNVAEFFVKERNASQELSRMSNEKAISYLTQIKA